LDQEEAIFMEPATQGDLERLRRELTRWLGDRIPGAEKLEISDLRKPEVGASNETLFFDARWAEANRPREQGMVARLKSMSGPQVFPEYDLGRQYRIVESLGRTDVLVPELFGYEEDEGVLGVPFYVMARIEGSCPRENPPYHSEGWLTDCTTAERAEIWRSGIAAFSRIHRLDWRESDFAFLDRKDLGKTPLEQELRYYRAFYEWTRKGRTHPLCEEALAWLEINQPRQPEPVGVVWGDAKLGNMIFQGTRCVGLCDWELAHLGNPIDDVTWYLMLDRCLSEGCNLPRLSGLADREGTLACWEEASGMKAVNFEYYELFSVYRFSVIMYRIISMYKEMDAWPADSDFDVSNLASNILEKEMAKRR
jgi:aminoglycoside phosphotransferase (APT) family kinase protein